MASTNLSAYDKTTIPNAKDFRFGIVVSEWNPDITENLLKGAWDTLIDNGVPENSIFKIYVPGSFELIYGCKHLIKTQDLNAVIAIGNVIQGETKHFDFVCEAVSQGIKDINVQFNVPTIFCVLTDSNKQQSIERSGGKHGNKGIESAIAAIKMAALKNNK
ncbi:MAG: 6,7-dimethyl-8-ribityllumazine synthase [Bacteroidetes bacterium]|nr:MAG: 6,7-dimethyl-8-ribityllumazine synthase [Bacteroidota bacterium]